MIADQPVIAIVPARGVSRGLPGKNLRHFAGKPMVVWTIEAARASALVDRVIVSTDDDAIMRTATEFGAEAPFRRPSRLAADDTPTLPVVLHALEHLNALDGIAVVLQPTSPLRQSSDIDSCIMRCTASGAPTAVSVVESAKPPEWMFTIDGKGLLRPIVARSFRATRRQDVSATYVLNGAVYVARIPWLRAGGALVGPETVAYVMPADRSVDVDTLLDFRLAELLSETNSGGNRP